MKLPEGFQVVNEIQILGFFNEYRFLSNFHPSEIFIEGIKYPSVEHAYMAYKTDDIAIKRKIAKLEKPSYAKKMGREIVLRSDWEYYRVAAMLNCLHLKFNTGTELAERLLATGNKYLEETNWWRDTFWGVHKSTATKAQIELGQLASDFASNLEKEIEDMPGGLNMLGKCLMMVRDNLRR